MLKFRKGSIHSISPEFAARAKVMSGKLDMGNALDIAKSLQGVNFNPATITKKAKRGNK